MVVSPMLATIPRSMTSRLRSARLKRDSGKPVSWGISHASALTATTTSGGKSPGATWPGSVVEPGQAPFEEPFTPLADNLAWCVKAPTNLLVGEAIGSVEDDLGTQHIYVR